jgi:hypothetical protein
MRLINKDLAHYYKLANRWYFGNKLPLDVVIKFSDIAVMGVTGREPYTRKATIKERRENKLNKTALCVTNRYHIRINKKYRDSMAIVVPTLIHEMVHVENWKLRGHGKKFDRRMLELAKAGAFNGLW